MKFTKELRFFICPEIIFYFMGVSDRSMDECPSNAENEDEKKENSELF